MASHPAHDEMARKGHERLEGEVRKVVFQNEDTGFAVVALQTPEGVVEAAGEIAPVVAGESLRLHGKWTEHPRFGRQFKAGWSERRTPTTVEGLRSYLGSGAFSGIGPELADRLVDHFGEGVLDALNSGPQRLREVEGIGPKRASTLSQSFRESMARHRLLAELRGLGLNGGSAARLYERQGAEAIAHVQRDPYRLIDELHGVGFQTAERIADRLGLERESPVRVAGLMLHLLRRAARDGHVCQTRDSIFAACAELEIGIEAAESALESLRLDGRLVVEDIGADTQCYLSGLWQDETGLAEALTRLFERPDWPSPAPRVLEAALARMQFDPDPVQREAVETALSTPFMVLTGGPGTGKTTVLRWLLEVLEAEGRGPVKLASPTGRAAKRLHEATGREASTIHRLLRFEPMTGGFVHDADDPIPAEYLVIDEVSMLDLPLAHALVQAIGPKTQVLFVGDADQLPSVGPGSVLHDLVTSDSVPTVRLQRIYRQESGSSIVTAAHSVREGRVPLGSPPGVPGDFFVSLRDDPEEAAQLVERLVCERIPKRFGLDPMRDVLVLAPMYRGPLGVDALNERLGARLNTSGPGPAWAAPFRAGDRVMAVRNDYEREVFNGDPGRVEALEGSRMLVRFGARLQEYGPEHLSDLVPSYCVTVHRAQGSEAKAVVIALGWSHHLLLQRRLLYTALTRGRNLVAIVAQPGVLERAVGTADDRQRRGHLGNRLP